MDQVMVVDEESDGYLVVHRCATVAEAEAWIGSMAARNPLKVARGGYGIDAPEPLINPPRSSSNHSENWSKV